MFPKCNQYVNLLTYYLVSIYSGAKIMKKILLIFLFTIQLYSNDVLNIASVPWRSSDVLKKTYEPLIELLRDKTGKEINFLITKNYMELSKRISSNHIDIAIFGANSYVDAKEILKDKIIYLGTSMYPNDHYNSLIIAHKDSGIKSISDLKNKNFAFTDLGSTSGYIYPKYMLYEEGITKPKEFFKTITMLKKHNRIYDAIAKKGIDAGGASNTEYHAAIKRNGDIYTIVKKSAPIPGDPIVANKKLGKEMIEKLQEIFKDANKSIYFKKYNSDLKGISVRSDKFYNIVRKVKEFNKKE